MKFAASFCALLALCVSASSAETIRAYHIGNSLTDNIHYGGLKDIATSQGDTYVYGKHVSPGVPLDYTWQYKSKTGSMYSYAQYGLYKTALKNYTWDVLTLEPFDNQIKGSTGDLAISEDFINYATPKSPKLQTYIYSRWPRRPQDSNGNFKPFDYTKLWTAKYTGSTNRYDLADERKGYFETLVNDLNAAETKLHNSVKMVPVGDVFAELDQKAKAKKLKGITDITQFYADSIHMNTTGAYVIGLTFYATMYKQNPIGEAVPGSYGKINSTLANEIQTSVWDVVTHNPYSGVNQGVPSPKLSSLVPEPMMVGALALVPMLTRRRRDARAA